MARAYVLTDQASMETIALVKDVLGKHVVLLVNTTGNVHGSSHVDLILNKYLVAEVPKMKEVLALGPKEPWLFGDDHAPGHYHGDCSVTKATGLIAWRKEFFTSNNGWRKLTPKKGTPLGDQLHQIFKHRVHNRLECLLGHQKDLIKLKEISEFCRSGGLLAADKGVPEGGTLFPSCLAVSIEKSLLSEYMVMAAF